MPAIDTLRIARNGGGKPVDGLDRFERLRGVVREVRVFSENFVVQFLLEVASSLERFVVLNEMSTDIVWIDNTQTCNAYNNAMSGIDDKSVLTEEGRLDGVFGIVDVSSCRALSGW